MKKLLALFLAAILALSTFGVALAADDPIVVTFWHNRSSGANLEALEASVKAFNETVGAEKGIVVEAVYIGGYDLLYSKTQLSTQAGDQPVIAVSGNTFVAPLIDDDLLADMAPYAEKTGYDISNLLDCFMEIPGNTDGELHSLPYVRSTPVLYYNKTLADSKGLTAPTTVEEWVEFAKALSAKDDNGEVLTWGMEIFQDFGYLNAAFLWQMGESMVAADGTSPALDGTSMLTHLTDWYNWVQEGVCRPYDSTNASATAQEMLFQGKLASLVMSSGSLKNCLRGMKEAGLELGIAPFPTYNLDHLAAECGGGQLVMVKKGNTEAQLEAGWEFLQFLMTDEQVMNNSIMTGYLPVTKSVAEYDGMLQFWAENPEYKVPFDQLLEFGVCQEYPAFENLQEFIQNIHSAVSLLIQEGSITPEQAVQMIKDTSAHLF